VIGLPTRIARSIGFSAVGVLIASALHANTARADDRGDVLDSRHKSYESPQNFELEMRFSPYRPNIDSDPSLHGTPFADTFNSPKNHLLFGLELDWQALRIPHIGTIGPGIGVQATSMSAPAREAADPSVLSAEDTSLEIYPFYLVAVVRFDAPMRELHIPIVPYVKGGIGYAIWRAYNDGGTSYAPINANTPNELISGRGHTFGTQLAAGVSLNLNAFDPHSAGQLDQSTGINNTYLFAEYYLAQLTGLGQEHALYVGANAWAFGIAFEF
jgi:hypothetical protein